MNGPTTISLIGMPGSGKSTVGIILAKQLGMRIVDSDLDIQSRAGRSLQSILDMEGYTALRRREEDVLLDIDLHNAVLATGGSAVYSDAAVARLQAAGPLVYLQTDLAALRQRIAAAPPRGIASDPALSLEQLCAQRIPLYERFASLTIVTDGKTPQQIATDIATSLPTNHQPL